MKLRYIKLFAVLSKLFAVLSVMVLSLYPVIELSRVIIEYHIVPQRWNGGMVHPWWGSPAGFWFELCVIWVLYLALPLVVVEIAEWFIRLGRRMEVNNERDE